MTKLRVIINGKAFDVTVEVTGSVQPTAPNSFSFTSAPAATPIPAAPAVKESAPARSAPQVPPSEAVQPVAKPTPAPKPAAPAGANQVTSPMAGVVMKVLVAPGQSVTEGQEVVVLEAMKMETPVYASASGVVSAVHVAQGAAVSEGAPLLDLN